MVSLLGKTARSGCRIVRRPSSLRAKSVFGSRACNRTASAKLVARMGSDRAGSSGRRRCDGVRGLWLHSTTAAIPAINRACTRFLQSGCPYVLSQRRAWPPVPSKAPRRCFHLRIGWKVTADRLGTVPAGRTVDRVGWRMAGDVTGSAGTRAGIAPASGRTGAQPRCPRRSPNVRTNTMTAQAPDRLNDRSATPCARHSPATGRNDVAVADPPVRGGAAVRRPG